MNSSKLLSTTSTVSSGRRIVALKPSGAIDVDNVSYFVIVSGTCMDWIFLSINFGISVGTKFG